MSDLIDDLLNIKADNAADAAERALLNERNADDWLEIVTCVRDAMSRSGMASLRDWAETDSDEIAILGLVDCFAGYHKVRSLKELRHKFGDDLAPAIGAAALVGFAGWQPCPEVLQ